MARTAIAAVPRAPRLLPTMLLLLLVVTACRRAAGTPVANELRCQCLQTYKGGRRDIVSVTVTSPGPHCTRTEVIATLKHGQKVCLDPENPRVKKIIENILNNKGSAN